MKSSDGVPIYFALSVSKRRENARMSYQLFSYHNQLFDFSLILLFFAAGGAGVLVGDRLEVQVEILSAG